MADGRPERPGGDIPHVRRRSELDHRATPLTGYRARSELHQRAGTVLASATRSMIRVRFFRVVPIATVLTAALCSGLTVLEGQPPPNPFPASSAHGLPIHLVQELDVLEP